MLTNPSPFLRYVSNVQEFDEQITNYAYREYVSLKYVLQSLRLSIIVR